MRKGLAKSAYAPTSAPLLVGFSGGADSTALLLALESLLPDARMLCAVHVEHGLRGDASKRDAEHAEEVCRRYGVDFHCARVRVSQAARWGIEAAARESRRAAFLSVAREKGADTLALAHHRDDQAETVLMRLFEGAGAGGVAGMRWRTPLSSKESGEGRLHVIRPLLGVSRAEIVEYLDARGASWVEDETNEDESRLRNRIRRHVVPAIREHLGDAALEGITRSAEIVAALACFLDEESADAGAAFIREEEDGLVVSPLSGLRARAQVVRAGVWRVVLERLLEDAPPRRRALGRWIEALDGLANGKNPSGVLHLPGGCEARREYDKMLFGPALAGVRTCEEQELRVPGKTLHRALGVEVEATLGGAGGAEGAWEACLDAEKVGGGARVRARRAGDRFRPPGRRGERKLKDYLIERKIPKALRDRIPLLAVGEKVAWILGEGVSAEFAPERNTPASRRLRLRARRILASPEGENSRVDERGKS